MGEIDAVNQPDYKIVLSVEANKNKYYITYENKKGHMHYREMTEFKKLRLFRAIKEKIKLISNRYNYGIDLRTVLRADSNVLSILDDETLNNDYKEMYLKALDGSGILPFKIKYDKNNRYATALKEAQKKLELKPGSEESNISKYDKIFGEGFDQHELASNTIRDNLHELSNNEENNYERE